MLKSVREYYKGNELKYVATLQCDRCTGFTEMFLTKDEYMDYCEDEFSVFHEANKNSRWLCPRCKQKIYTFVTIERKLAKEIEFSQDVSFVLVK